MKKVRGNMNLILDKCNLNKIIIRGKKLNCRWFGNTIIVFSDNDDPILLDILNKIDLYKEIWR